MVAPEIKLEVQPRRPIFEKCSHLRDKGGVLTLITPVEFALTPTVVAAGLENTKFKFSSSISIIISHIVQASITPGFFFLKTLR